MLWWLRDRVAWTALRMAIKCADSLSFFVKKSETLHFPAMCSTWIKEFCTFSLTALSQIWMYRKPFVVMLWDHWTESASSLQIVIGPVENLRRCHNYKGCWQCIGVVLCIDFRFGWITSGTGLAFGSPFDWASKPYDEANYGVRLEMIDKDRWIIWFWYRLILGTSWHLPWPQVWMDWERIGQECEIEVGFCWRIW